MRIVWTALMIGLFVGALACGSTHNMNHNGHGNTNSAQNTPAQPSGASSVTAANANQATPVAAIDAAAIYRDRSCVGCHGATGRSQIAGTPDFTSAAWQQKNADAAIIAQIKNGKPPKMPAYGAQLNDAQISALVAYIRTFRK